MLRQIEVPRLLTADETARFSGWTSLVRQGYLCIRAGLSRHWREPCRRRVHSMRHGIPARSVALVLMIGAASAVCGHSGYATELGTPGPVLAPIEHQPYYQGERELFGYRPAFVPNPVTFDRRNYPYIRTADDNHGSGAVVQTLNQRGRWVRLGFKSAILRKCPTWTGRFRSGIGSEQRIVFDDRDHAYMLVQNADVSNSDPEAPQRSFLLHSRDHCRTWTAYELPFKPVRLEYDNGHNECVRPPVILGKEGNTLSLLAPARAPGGGLAIPPAPVTIAEDTMGPPNHSGAANGCVTRGSLTHIVWGSRLPQEGVVGTLHYAATYDHDTGQVSPPVFIGNTGLRVDGHNSPGICMDRQGYLHVIMGAHGGKKGQRFKYTVSAQPESTASWTEPVGLVSGYTYRSLLCDENDVLHLVTRKNGVPVKLVYLRKEPGGDWSEDRDLVVPFQGGYAIYYHKLAQDRRGRLFVSYWSYLGITNPEQEAAYRERWPDEEIPGVGSNVAYPHDPAMLISDDGGQTWRLTTTKDFLVGIDKG